MAQCATARERVLALDDLLRALSTRAGQRVAFTNGCFDLIHTGHVRSLEHAASLADILVVGINDDRSVRILKGPGRPLIPADERAELVAALQCVDYVTVFSEATAESLIATIRPDVYVKGGDYDETTLPEAPIVRSYGGVIALAPLIPSRSTSAIIDTIRGSA